MGIPKYPDVPELTVKQIRQITEITFYKEILPTKCDVIFVFGGSHPGNWQAPLEAYNKGFSNQIIITGGSSSSGMRHSDWIYEDISEAEVIVNKLIENGVSRDKIFYETSSKHSIDNVIQAKKVFDFSSINTLLFVCKSLAAGRQYRTLKKHLPTNITFIPFPFDTSFDGEFTITRDNWMNNEKSRSLVFGEFLRNMTYGKKGGITAPDNVVVGLDDIVSYYYHLLD
ncbi:YdcF family protein [Bacillus sp. F19]|nr:YdcF family protein [Bacillus sp. F19]